MRSKVMCFTRCLPLPGLRVVIPCMCLLGMFLLGLPGCDPQSDNSLDVKQVRYWQIPPQGATFPTPRSVSVGPNDEVVVLDRAGRVLIFDREGKLLRQWRMPINEDGNAEGTCWLRDGRIAVADTHYHRIVFFDDHGKVLSMIGKSSPQGAEFTKQAPPGTFVFPVSVVQDDQENIYVSEYGGNDRIQKFTKDGKHLKTFGTAGTGPGEFQRASGMLWHRDSNGQGLIYIADAENGRVQVFTDEGQYLRSIGRSELSTDHAAAITQEAETADSLGKSAKKDKPDTTDKTGDSAPAGSSDGNVGPIAADGAVGGAADGTAWSAKSQADSAEVAMRFPYDVDMGPDGNLYVVEWGAGRFTVVSPRGELIGRYGQPGMGAGQFRTPWGLAVDSQGRVIVADTENRRLAVVTLP